MLRKIKYDNGIREIYLGNFRILKYKRYETFLEFKFKQMQEFLLDHTHINKTNKKGIYFLLLCSIDPALPKNTVSFFMIFI
ncbi:hypothetical protein [Campylobacter novaezeelandiae]|uniref:hypothetical protein n=1 Tax=Campylobacter novaezeelandiae TaxID=2267891 RepID=UPI001C1E2833|nr:hypothetical protein [Campylobacter novaezeelandiae]